MLIYNPSLDDIEKIVDLENETWPEGIRASRSEFESRIKTFPEGVIAIKSDSGEIVGLITSMIIDKEEVSRLKRWENITSDGMIYRHNPDGNSLYIVSLGVSPRYRRRGLGKKLLQTQIDLGKKLCLDYLVLGSRVPDFYKYDGTIEEYLAEKDDEGYSIDSLVRFYQRCGLRVEEVKANYMEDDKESRNYGVIMVKEL
jgi:ribosomal protein S18 acetylase RimI-like enzyme